MKSVQFETEFAGRTAATAGWRSLYRRSLGERFCTDKRRECFYVRRAGELRLKVPMEQIASWKTWAEKLIDGETNDN